MHQVRQERELDTVCTYVQYLLLLTCSPALGDPRLVAAILQYCGRIGALGGRKRMDGWTLLGFLLPQRISGICSGN
jgi:hypothetical protein